MSWSLIHIYIVLIFKIDDTDYTIKIFDTSHYIFDAPTYIFDISSNIFNILLRVKPVTCIRQSHTNFYLKKIEFEILSNQNGRIQKIIYRLLTISGQYYYLLA